MLPEQFTSLLLVAACLLGSHLAACLVCFSFVVEVQRRENSEVKVSNRRQEYFLNNYPRVYFGYSLPLSPWIVIRMSITDTRDCEPLSFLESLSIFYYFAFLTVSFINIYLNTSLLYIKRSCQA